MCALRRITAHPNVVALRDCFARGNELCLVFDFLALDLADQAKMHMAAA